MTKLMENRKVVWEEMMKNSIHDAAVAVLTESGVDGLRMDRVARAAEVATGTLYNYFKSKEELLYHVVLKLFEPLHQKLLEIRDQKIPASDKLIEYFRIVYSVFVENQSLITVLSNKKKDISLKTKSGENLDQEIDRIIIKIVSQIIQEGIEQAVFRPCDVSKTATLIHGAILGLINAKIAGNDRSESIEEDVAACRALLFQGIHIQ